MTKQILTIWERRAIQARKAWQRYGTPYMNSWFWLEPAPVKPSKRHRRG